MVLRAFDEAGWWIHTNLQLQVFLFSSASEVGAFFDGDAGVKDDCEDTIDKGKRPEDGSLKETHSEIHFQSYEGK